MLSTFKNLVGLTSQVIRKCEFQSYCKNRELLFAIGCDFSTKNQRQNFHSGTPRMIDYRTLEKRRAAVQHSRVVNRVAVVQSINETTKRNQGYFPLCDLKNLKIKGMLFKEIPIVHIKSTKNNTIMTITEKGVQKVFRSCGMEGFKNTRKGTNVAAQTLGCSFGLRAIKEGFKSVRVLIKGIGPGRLSSIKGLQLAGMDIISITDGTRDIARQRPRKQRRV